MATNDHLVTKITRLQDCEKNKCYPDLVVFAGKRNEMSEDYHLKVSAA